jgi:cytoskeletal protein CcmA (bactofilin family)
MSAKVPVPLKVPAPLKSAARRFLDRAPVSPTMIGNLSGAGPFVVAGEVRGDGEFAGDLNVAVGGEWTGNIRARRAIIAGSITGRLCVSQKLEIGHSAVIRGSVSARQIAIAKGAIVDGEIEITSGDEMVQFDEKRGA